MSDDLLRRLKTPVGFQDVPVIQQEAADRIEELEALLEECKMTLARTYKWADGLRLYADAGTSLAPVFIEVRDTLTKLLREKENAG